MKTNPNVPVVYLEVQDIFSRRRTNMVQSRFAPSAVASGVIARCRKV